MGTICPHQRHAMSAVVPHPPVRRVGNPKADYPAGPAGMGASRRQLLAATDPARRLGHPTAGLPTAGLPMRPAGMGASRGRRCVVAALAAADRDRRFDQLAAGFPMDLGMTLAPLQRVRQVRTRRLLCHANQPQSRPNRKGQTTSAAARRDTWHRSRNRDCPARAQTSANHAPGPWNQGRLWDCPVLTHQPREVRDRYRIRRAPNQA